MSLIKIFKLLPLILILIVALLVRLYKIDNPIADWHSWRQADTASVTENFAQKGLNLLLPTFHDLSSLPTGQYDNPNGYRMVEVPIYNALHLGVYRLFPALGLDEAGRLTSVLLSLLSIVFLYLIVNKLSGYSIAILTSIFMAVLPFNIYYSRVVLPEPLMILTLLISYWLLLRTTTKNSLSKRLYLIFSAIFLSLAIMVKPYALFFTLPHLVFLLRTYVNNELNIYDLLGFAAISLIPFGLWRKYITRYPEGVPDNTWLFNKDGIRFRPAWFRWLFGERLGKLILGSWGTVLLALGLIAKPKKEGTVYWLWAIGIMAYFSIFAGGNVRHDYYQAIIMPFICIFLAKGTYQLLSLSKTVYSGYLAVIMAFFIVIFTIGFSWYEIKGYYQVNNPAMVEAGNRVDEITPKDALVIAPYEGDTAFLYQTHRSGWPSGHEIEKNISEGATYYVSTSYGDQAKQLEERYTLVEKSANFIIIKLIPKNK